MFYDFIYRWIWRIIPLHLEEYHDMETEIDYNCTKGTNISIAYIFYIILIYFIKDYDMNRERVIYSLRDGQGTRMRGWSRWWDSRRR